MKKTVLYNGKLYLEKGKFAEACLIEDGVITAIGTDEEMLARAGGADKIDCCGRTVIPGLNDSHCHILMCAQLRSSVPLLGATSIDDVVARGKAFLAAHPNATSLRGMGWNVVAFTEGEKRDLVRQDLDRISTEVPIFFERACGHMGVANTCALKLAGVTAATEDVYGGVIGREPDGSPNGQFVDNAKPVLTDHMPPQNLDDLEQNFVDQLAYAASCGLTSVQTNDPGNTLPVDDFYPFIHKFNAEGKLTLRYHTQNGFADVEEFARFLKTERNNPQYDDVLTFGPLKLFKDGSIGGRSALMREDYLDDPGNRGVSVHTDEEMDAFCALADKNGVQVLTHCIGDAAIESMLNCYEKILHDGKNPLRHGIIHCQMMDKPLMERIAQDGILAVEQPIFLNSDMHSLSSRIPESLARTSNAYRSMMRLGIPQSFGTDSPVEDCNPFPCIYCAVTRRDLSGQPAGGYYPEECISVEDAIDAYTIGSAYTQFMEDRKGRIKVGYVADLAVLDRDVFTCEPMEIKDAHSVLTMMGGRITHKA